MKLVLGITTGTIATNLDMNASAQAIRPLGDPQTIIHAYRHLYRQGLKVVNYSTPSRHVLLRTLQHAFRSTPRHEFDPAKIANTLRFLERATTVAGIEHKIVKNLLLSRYWEQPKLLQRTKSHVLTGLGLREEERRLRKSAFEQYNSTLALLNESLGTCLK